MANFSFDFKQTWCTFQITNKKNLVHNQNSKRKKTHVIKRKVGKRWQQKTRAKQPLLARVTTQPLNQKKLNYS